MRVANYYRVSTKLQQDRFSLAAQKTELSAYAKKQKWEIIDEFKDVESGGTLEKSGLNALLDLVESGRIDVVLCMDQDRLSRLDTVSWEYLKSVLRENEVKIAEPTGTITDLTNEDDEFMSDLRNLMAQRDKRNVVKRMMYGKRQRLREGKGWGRTPLEYYYDKNEAKFFVKKGWEWVIPFIDDLYINKRYGMRLISQELNKISKTPSGRDWNDQLVNSRLVSKAYHGIQEMNFSNGETIAAAVFEPLRTEESYNKIQEIRMKRREQFSVNTRTSQININLLKYVPITCGYCGRVIFIGQSGTQKYPKFLAEHGRAKEMRTGKTCGISINAKRYEYNLIKAMRDILASEELSKKYINFETNEDELQHLEEIENKSVKSLNDLNHSRDLLLDLYLSKDIDKNRYVERNAQLDKKIAVTEEQVEKLKRKIAAINKNTWNYETLYSYIGVAKRIGTDLTRHEQARIIGDIFTKGVLTKNELTLTTEVYNGIPVEVNIPVVDNTRTINRWMRQDEREGNVIYRY